MVNLPARIDAMKRSSADTDDLQLCFNKSHFNRSDFSTERFINLARRRTTLDIIYNDLRVYLRHLQNSMIELINDDYAEFVNLSSSLAVLKECIDKVVLNVDTSRTLFNESVVVVQDAAEFVAQKINELVANRLQQILMRDKIALLLALQRLHSCLERRPTGLSSWLTKLIDLLVEVELRYSRISEEEVPPKATTCRQTCYSRIKKIIIEELIADMNASFSNVSNILAVLSLVGKMDVAVAKIASIVVADHLTMDTDSSDKFQLLDGLFCEILVLRKKWMDVLERQGQLRKNTECFVDSVLLSHCSSFLDSKFGSVFVPSDTRLFHTCYYRTMKFIREWPLPTKSTTKHHYRVVSAALKAIFGKFNTVVYFKMVTQQYHVDIRSKSAAAHLTDDRSGVASGVCLNALPNTILTALRTLFADDVFVSTLVEKFWIFTLNALSTFIDWGKATNAEYRKSPETWLQLVILVRDMAVFKSGLSDVYSQTIVPLLRDFRVVEMEPFDKCLDVFYAELERIRAGVLQSIAALITSKSTSEILAVSDIPKQYRWTKKAAPTCFSPYLQSTFGVCEQFSAAASQIGWTSDDIALVMNRVVEQLTSVFCEKAEQVLESVELTGSSLQRFKRKQQPSDGGLATDSDEAKIRAQLAFDVLFMRQRAMKNGVDAVGRLDEICKRVRVDCQPTPQ